MLDKGRHEYVGLHAWGGGAYATDYWQRLNAPLFGSRISTIPAALPRDRMKKDPLIRSDRPTTHDLLQVAPYAEALARFVVTCQTPMAIGIQGEWGSGKSSLMWMVRDHLQPPDKSEPKDEYLAVDPHREERIRLSRLAGDKTPRAQFAEQLRTRVFEFETWQFGVVEPEALGLRLLEVLADSLGADLSAQWERRRADANDAAPASTGMQLWQRARGALHSLAPVAAGAARTAAPVAAAIAHGMSGGIVDGQTLLRGVSGHGTAAVQRDQVLTQYKDLFRQFVQRALLELEYSRLVILVDDLDRVHPVHAVTMLEVLKNFMDVEGCIFVLACDYQVVRAGVQQKFGITDERKAQAFFDKIIQVPFDVPVEQYRINRMLSTFLEDKKARLPHQANGSFDKWVDFQRELAPLVRLAVGRNPRAFKRFLNTLELLAAVAHATQRARKKSSPVWERTEAWQALVILVALQVRWPSISRWLGAEASSLSSEDSSSGAASREMATRLNALIGQAESGEALEQLRLVAQEEAGEIVEDELINDSTSVNELQEFLAHVLRLVDTNEENQEFDAAEVKALSEIAGLLSVTARGRPVQLTGRDKLLRAVASIPQRRASNLLVKLIQDLDQARTNFPGCTGCQAYPNQIYYQFRRPDGGSEAVLKIGKGGDLTVWYPRDTGLGLPLDQWSQHATREREGENPLLAFPPEFLDGLSDADATAFRVTTRDWMREVWSAAEARRRTQTAAPPPAHGVVEPTIPEP